MFHNSNAEFGFKQAILCLQLAVGLVAVVTFTACNQTSMPDLNIGDLAPDFALKNSQGEVIRLSDYRGSKNVVVYFYPKDETAGCTAQACSFRDSYEDFTDAGAEVIGISKDGALSHDKFSANHRLPFVLLTDAGGIVARAWGVDGFFSPFGGRVTFIIDKEGRILHKYDSQLFATRHVQEALDALRKAPK